MDNKTRAELAYIGIAQAELQQKMIHMPVNREYFEVLAEFNALSKRFWELFQDDKTQHRRDWIDDAQEGAS